MILTTRMNLALMIRFEDIKDSVICCRSFFYAFNDKRYPLQFIQVNK